MSHNIMDAAYDVVARELSRQDLKPGLMARCAAEAMGDDKIAKSLYLKYRAEQICEEMKESSRREAESKRQEQERIRRARAPKSRPLPPSTPIGPATSGQKAFGWTITAIATLIALGMLILIWMGEIK